MDSWEDEFRSFLEERLRLETAFPESPFPCLLRIATGVFARDDSVSPLRLAIDRRISLRGATAE